MGLSVRRVSPSLAAALLAVGLCVPAQAAFVQFSDRATFDALGPFVGVDWGVFGPDGTVISTPDSRNVGGITIGVGSSQGALQRYDEGTSFIGNFAAGDHLLGDAGSESDSFIIRFGSPVEGFGTQLDPHDIRGSYTGSVELFDTGNNLLFTAPFAGDHTGAQDNTAPFVGITSDVADIAFAMFWINQTDPSLPSRSGALLMNRLDVLTPAAVPEPTPLALMGVAFVSFFGYRFLLRKASA